MHASSHPNDIARDPILDGRDSLRVVKLRLALTLVTVALLPIAAVSPVLRSVASEASLSHQLRLEAVATVAATKAGAEIDAIRAAMAGLQASPQVEAAARVDADQVATTEASSTLASLVRRPSGAVSAVTLVVPSGVRAAAGQPFDLRRLPAEPASAIVPGSGPSARTLLLVTTVPAASGTPERTLAAIVELEPLLAWAASTAQLPGRSLVLLDAEGSPVVESHVTFDPAALPSQLLDLALDAADDAEGRSTIVAEGLEGWSVTAAAPIPLTSLPTEALAALIALITLVVGLTIWMAHQILRPAAQLEASRSRLRELYESAREAALRDSLTGLGNHRSFQEAVARMVEGSRRYNAPFALVLFDVDEFKRVNDTRGHAVGDQLLTELGDLIRATIRHSDSGYRVGGDEFALLLPHTDAAGAATLTRRLLNRALDDRGVGAYRGPISFSAGITACPEYATSRLELTAQADAALYRGKRAGRTVITAYDPDRDHGHVDEEMRAELSSAISAVIETSLLTPVYQPIVDLGTGLVSGYEGLVRVAPSSTFPHAGALFDAAETSGRVLDLDRAALDTVLAGARGIDPSLHLSLNISPLTLEASEFNATVLLAILRRHAMPPERVVLELTERQAARDPERLGNAIRALQAAGVRVAADDVGAGNAGLRLLSQYRFDVVKIDLSLVQGAGQDQGLSVLTSLVQMAARLGATTIAEGVETAGQLRTIRRLGVTGGQGYLLGRPAPDAPGGWVDLIALEREADDLGDGDGAPDQAGVDSPSRRRSISPLKTSSVSNE